MEEDIKKNNTGGVKFKTLDAVRALATMMVFIFHAGYLLPSFINQSNKFGLGKFIYVGGTVGVSVFFVLSGFLLFYQMYKKKEGLDAEKVKDYTRKRLLRILPLYYFSLFFIVFVFKRDMIFAQDGLRSIIYNLFFIRGIKGANGGGTITINPVYWSLIVEMHFYFFLPIFYYIFNKYKKVSLFFILALLGILYRIIIVTKLGNPSMQLLRFTPANFDFFAFGMLGAYLYVNHSKLLNFLGKAHSQIICLSVFLLFIYFYDLDFLPTLSYIFAATLLGIITILCILSFLSNEQSFLGKLFTSTPVLFVGKISFSIFIWHTVVINQFGGTALSSATQFILDAFVTLVVSTISYYAIEAPFLKLKSKFDSRAKKLMLTDSVF